MGRILAVKVAVDAAIPGFYTYISPAHFEENIQVGQAVLVPLGSRQVTGYVMALKEVPEPLPAKYKAILEIINFEPLFGPSLSRLIDFISHYYFYPPGLCVREILPGGLAPLVDKLIVPATPDTPGAFGSLLGAEAELLEQLVNCPKGLNYKELEALGFGSAIKKLLAAGQIAVRYSLTRKTPQAQQQWWVGPASEVISPLPRLGPKERELRELVGEGPPKPLSYYANYLKNPLMQARSLAAKGLVELSCHEIYRDDPNRALAPANPLAPPPTPTAQQAVALTALEAAINSEGYQGFLLFGVTGSGKTEVYLRVAEQVLASGREVLWLTAEIGLTLGLEGILKARFSAEKVAVLHSGLTPAQRHDQWLRIRRGEAPLVLGARSAVFAPLENVGLVVVDEEHDWAFKQDDGLRYQGRDLARWRAVEAGATLVLGSATPSFESYQAAVSGRLTLLKMTERPGQAILPEVELVDQGAEPSRFRRALSPVLQKRLGETLDRGEQALLFINRRGLANLPMCLKCGEALKCPHCSRNLTLHGPDGGGEIFETHAALTGPQILICHCCGYRAHPPEGCPACLSPLFRYFGVGTEKLLEIATKNFPQARGARLDTDSVRRRGGFKSILDKFGRGEYNLLVGTQMAAKGHDFPRLTLVGVVDADLGLNLPDFRAAERTFQLLSQVAGRAGRDQTPGTVLIQTLTPRHPVLQAAASHDYERFFEGEIKARLELGYPPFARLALVRLSGPHEESLAQLARDITDLGRPFLVAGDGLDILGPVPSPMARIKERYRYQILIRATDASQRHKFLEKWLPLVRAQLPQELRLTVDIDPYNLM